jgi:hypothetical protein
VFANAEAFHLADKPANDQLIDGSVAAVAVLHDALTS